MIFIDNFFFEKIRLIFDIQNWLWKYDFGTFWQTVITRRNFSQTFPWWHVDSWPKSLLFRTHFLWNSTTELILLLNTKCEGKTLMVKPNKSSYWSILKFEFLQTDVTMKRDFSTWHFLKIVAVLFLFFEKLFMFGLTSNVLSLHFVFSSRQNSNVDNFLPESDIAHSQSF